jgi:hypothetical protein
MRSASHGLGFDPTIGAPARLGARTGIVRWLLGDIGRDQADGCQSAPRAKRRRPGDRPLATLFGFIAAPEEHFFFKPNVTRLAARAYGVDLPYVSHPNAESYRQVLDFAALAWSDLADLRPRDMIDIQSFLWVQGSDEYA